LTSFYKLVMIIRSAFDIVRIMYIFYKTSHRDEEVKCTVSSPLVSVQCLGYLGNTHLSSTKFESYGEYKNFLQALIRHFWKLRHLITKIRLVSKKSLNLNGSRYGRV
jgi:hypothetical protein